MVIEHLSRTAKIKGIDLLGTGDFTHPTWAKELKEKLTPLGNGLFIHNGTYFILTAEVSNIFFHEGKARKIHNLILAPDFEAVEKISRRLSRFGNLTADGRPILKLPAKDLITEVLEASPLSMIIPSHIWTPHFSLFGSNNGFDSIEECFGNNKAYIYALETGLSSDPGMNWRLSFLDRFTLISNSDAHSPSRLGREANIFEGELSYEELTATLKKKDKSKFLLTTEYFPEEGKYHYDGHRKCQVVLSPKESLSHKNLCPVCGGRLTIGVMHRVEELADREEDFVPKNSIPFKRLVPLEEIISKAIEKGRDTAAVEAEYKKLVQHFGSEFRILLDLDEEEMKEAMPPKILKGIIRVRRGELTIRPGYDGEYGEISLFKKEEDKPVQLTFF